MSDLITRLETLLEPVLADLGYGLVRVSYAGKTRPILQLIIERLDGEGVAIEDCVKASRQVSAIMDVEDPIKSAYRLEVSSPGLDRPLVKPEHFKRFVGNEIKVEAHAPLEGRRRFQGVLQTADDNGIVVVWDEGEEQVEASLLYAMIARAKLVPQF